MTLRLFTAGIVKGGVGGVVTVCETSLGCLSVVTFELVNCGACAMGKAQSNRSII